MSESILIPKTGAEPTMTDDAADVHIHRMWSHPRYGLKLGVHLPAPWEDDGEAKETFKELDYDRTHRGWNDANKEWTADADALNHVIAHMVTEGYDVTVDLQTARQFEAEFEAVFLPSYRDEHEFDVPAYTTHTDEEAGKDYDRCTECGDERFHSHGGFDEMFHYPECSLYEEAADPDKDDWELVDDAAEPEPETTDADETMTDSTPETETEPESEDADDAEHAHSLAGMDSREQIRWVLREIGSGTNAEISESTEISRSTVTIVTKDMWDDGDLEREKDGRSNIYSLPDGDGDSDADADADAEDTDAAESDDDADADETETDGGVAAAVAPTLETFQADAEAAGERDGVMPVDRDYDHSRMVPHPAAVVDYREVDGELTEALATIENRHMTGWLPHLALSGPTGAAKTEFAKNIALELEAPLYTIQCSDAMDMKEVIGGPTLVNDETWWVDGNGVKALLASQEQEVVLLIDEVNRVSSRIKSALMGLLDSRAEVILDGRGGEVIQGVPENIIVVSTMNKGTGYTVNPIDNAEKRRIGDEYEIDFLGRVDREQEIDLLVEQTPAEHALASRLVDCANDLRDKADDESAISFGMTTAIVLDWARGAFGRQDVCEDPVVRAAQRVFITPFMDSPDARQLATQIIERNLAGCPVDDLAVRKWAGEDVSDLGLEDDDEHIRCSACEYAVTVADATAGLTATMQCPKCGDDCVRE